MSSYSCTVPPRRAKEHKDQLLVVSILFFVAALLSLLSAFALYPVWVYVPLACFAFFCTTTSALAFLVWVDVR